MKYKIEKGSVQETLLIPLYGRKMAMDLYPDLFADVYMTTVGLYFSVENEQDLAAWSDDFLSVVRKGYMTGYRKLDKRYGFFANALFRIVDKTRMCQVIEITFK